MVLGQSVVDSDVEIGLPATAAVGLLSVSDPGCHHRET